ncbi:MAG: Coenzyme F420 hydrogenase/dehydrogenase, beta subunit C-terminal domain [Rikenellaceae bacterium]
MISLASYRDCSGCGACLASCQSGAITLNEDRYGFLYPHIDPTLCVECGACRGVCPAIQTPIFTPPLRAFACYRSNHQERLGSTSGGLATSIALAIIKLGGVVYGSRFSPPFRVVHTRCTTPEEVLELRGSKYVQSDMRDILPQIRHDLKQNKRVLFIGTPCQVAGVKALCKGSVGVLYTVDILCHGVPSLKLLTETLPKGLATQQIKEMQFRDGSKYIFRITNYDGSHYERDLSKDIFMKGFFNGVTTRPSCSVCRYAQERRVSDLTIGDFWGLRSTTITDYENGVSLALVNNTKGEELMRICESDITKEERPTNEAIRGNRPLNRPLQHNTRTLVFRILYPTLGYVPALWISLPDKMSTMYAKDLLSNLKRTKR